MFRSRSTLQLSVEVCFFRWCFIREFVIVFSHFISPNTNTLERHRLTFPSETHNLLRLVRPIQVSHLIF